MQTLGEQEVALERQYGVCPACGGKLFPLDEELALLPGCLTPGLEEVLVRLGSWMPFEEAQRLLVDWLKLNSLSEVTVRRHAEGAGAAWVDIQDEDARALERGEEQPGPSSAQLVVEVDGAMVPLAGGEWAEVKTVAIGEVDGVMTEPGTLKEMSYFSRLTDAVDFSRQALTETGRRGVGAGGDVALVSGGAEWIQGLSLSRKRAHSRLSPRREIRGGHRLGAIGGRAFAG